MPFEWRHNGSAWMTGQIIVQYLYWFDRRISGRSVLLLMDNFSAHKLAVECMMETQPLRNVRICFLPENSTSIHQPPDQGIIQNFKVYYRQSWLQYMLTELENERDPLKTMNVLKAARFSIAAWNNSVKARTYANCFRKSGISGPVYGPHPLPKEKRHKQQSDLDDETDAAALARLRTMIRDIVSRRQIHQAVNVEDFVDPVSEQVDDSDEDLVEMISQQFDPDREAETDEECQNIPRVSTIKAMEAVHILQTYEEQAEKGTKAYLKTFNSYEKELNIRRVANMSQPSIQCFFSSCNDILVITILTLTPKKTGLARFHCSTILPLYLEDDTLDYITTF